MVTVEPYAAADVENSVPADVLIDWDGYETAALHLNTTARARVQMSHVVVQDLQAVGARGRAKARARARARVRVRVQARDRARDTHQEQPHP